MKGSMFLAKKSNNFALPPSLTQTISRLPPTHSISTGAIPSTLGRMKKHCNEKKFLIFEQSIRHPVACCGVLHFELRLLITIEEVFMRCHANELCLSAHAKLCKTCISCNTCQFQQSKHSLLFYVAPAYPACYHAASITCTLLLNLTKGFIWQAE